MVINGLRCEGYNKPCVETSFNFDMNGLTVLTLEAPTPQNGQKHSNNSTECVWPLCGVGAKRLKS